LDQTGTSEVDVRHFVTITSPITKIELPIPPISSTPHPEGAITDQAAVLGDNINTQYPILLLTFAALLLIVAIPGLLLFFYNQKSVIELFHSPDDKGNVSQIMPVRSYLVLLVLSLFILLFHILIFYQGIFPMFGKFLTGLSGITIYGLLILIMILLIYGIINKVYISWIVSIVLFSILIVSSIITILSYKYSEIIELLKFPKLENDIFVKFPLKSIYLLIPILYILTASLIIIIRSKKYFNKQYGI
jgi:hypothetical protein